MPTWNLEPAWRSNRQRAWVHGTWHVGPTPNHLICSLTMEQRAPNKQEGVTAEIELSTIEWSSQQVPIAWIDRTSVHRWGRFSVFNGLMIVPGRCSPSLTPEGSMSRTPTLTKLEPTASWSRYGTGRRPFVASIWNAKPLLDHTRWGLGWSKAQWRANLPHFQCALAVGNSKWCVEAATSPKNQVSNYDLDAWYVSENLWPTPQLVPPGMLQWGKKEGRHAEPESIVVNHFYSCLLQNISSRQIVHAYHWSCNRVDMQLPRLRLSMMYASRKSPHVQKRHGWGAVSKDTNTAWTCAISRICLARSRTTAVFGVFLQAVGCKTDRFCRSSHRARTKFYSGSVAAMCFFGRWIVGVTEPLGTPQP